MLLLLTQRETASVLRLSTRTLERLRLQGLGPKVIYPRGRAHRHDNRH
jgi:hypothetical protein